MILPNLAGPLLLVVWTVLMFLIVPWQRVKELSLVGLIGGFGVGLVLNYLMINTFGFWIFHNVDIIYISRIPLLLIACWLPSIIVFSHFLAQYRNAVLTWLILAAFPLGATLTHWLLRANDMLSYYNWNHQLTLLVSLGIHAAIMFYLYTAGYLENLNRKTV